jgi:hypothetical protein
MGKPRSAPGPWGAHPSPEMGFKVVSVFQEAKWMPPVQTALV